MDDQVAWGITTNKVNATKSKAMCMSFHWLKDREAQQQFKFLWDHGATNLANYYTKLHPVVQNTIDEGEYIPINPSGKQISPNAIRSSIRKYLNDNQVKQTAFM